MNTAVLLSLLRTDYLDDNVQPYLWSDTTLINHLNEAEREAHIRAELIKDRTARYLSASDISFTQSTKTIASAAGDLSPFKAGMTITVYGSTDNDGQYTVQTEGSASLVVNETLTDESAGAAIQIYCPLTHVLLVDGVDIYDASPKITRVLRWRTATNTVDGAIAKESHLDELDQTWRTNESSEPLILVHTEKKLIFSPIPTFDDPTTTVLVTMDVARYPYRDLVAGGGEPEIPFEYHLSLLDYASYLAYSKQDAETQDNTKMTTHLAKFDARFGPRPSAKLIEARKGPRNVRLRAKEFGE